MPLHGLVDIHRVQAGGIEARKPHVPDHHDPERVLGILEAYRQGLSLLLVPDVLLPLWPVRGTSGHDYLQHAASLPFRRGIILRAADPVGTECDDCVPQFDAEPPTHANDHRLALHRVQASLEMSDEIGGDQLDSLRVTDDGFQGGPARHESLPAELLLALGDLLELCIQHGGLRRV
jgi:hypothetical protein